MRTLLLTLPTVSVVLAALAMTASAAAATPADQATAEALFQEGKRLATVGDFTNACPKFAESQRLDPGSGTLLNLGACYEKLGKLASAWAAFKDAEGAARASGNKEREVEAARRAEALAPRLPKLAIVVPPGARVPGFELRRDGSTVGEPQWGSAIPIDAGEHTLEATAPGRRTWTKSVTVAGTSSSTVEVEPLAPGPIEVKAKTPEAPSAPYWNGQRVAGVVIGGAGLVGMAIGAVFGAQSANKNSASMAYCPSTPTMCYAPGVSLRNDAYSAATASTIAFIAGGVGVATGLVTFFTASTGTKPPPKAIGVAVGPRGVTVEGSW